MSDENKQTSDLDTELEELRDTFQAVLDESTKEQAEEPVIQALDYSPDPGDNEEDESPAHTGEAEENAENTAKKTKKGKKKIPLAAVIIPVVLCLLLIIPLGLFSVLSVAVPDFSNFMSSASAAIFAKTEEQRLEKYNDALKYCADGSKLASMKQFILEEIVLTTAKTQGYAAAKDYADQNLTDEMKEKPSSKEFKEFLTLGDKLNVIADKIFPTAVEAVGDKKDTEGLDFDALAKRIDTPEIMQESISSSLKFLCEAIAAENAAQTKEELQGALGLYMNSYSVLDDMGASCKLLLENITLKLFSKGYIYEANLVINNLYKSAPEEEIKSDNKEFTDVIADLEEIKKAPCDIYAAAAKLYGEGKTAEADFIAEINNQIISANVAVTLSDNAIKGLAQVAITVTEGFDALKESNLTKANACFTSALAALQTFDFPYESVAVEAAKVFFSMGDTQSANSIKTQYLAEFTPEKQEDKDFFSLLDTIFKSQSAANDAFYPHYSATSYGQAMDKATVLADLDKLITAQSTNIDKAFVDYYKYITVSFTDKNKEEMATYLNSFESKLSEYPLIYGYALGQLYVDNGEFDKAVELADKMLKVNIADDFANSVKALALRTENKLDEALAVAEKGMELSGAVQYCALEAAIDYFLKADYSASFDIIKSLFSGNALTETACELVKVIEAKYTGEDEALKADIAKYSADVDQIFQQYGLTASDSAKGLIDGTLKPEDVFLKAPYDFR